MIQAIRAHRYYGITAYSGNAVIWRRIDKDGVPMYREIIVRLPDGFRVKDGQIITPSGVVCETTLNGDEVYLRWGENDQVRCQPVTTVGDFDQLPPEE